MKLPVYILEKDIKLKNFELDKTHLEILLYVKNKYPIPISAENIKLQLINSKNKIFANAAVSDRKISALGTENIIITVAVENKEASEFISDFINLNKIICMLKILSGKAKLFSVFPINLTNKIINLNIFDFIKSLCK